MKDKSLLAFSTLMDKMKDYRIRIERGIKLELQRYVKSCFHNSLSYALEKGKRIRPIILLLSAESVNKSDVDPLSAAIAIELLHTESIIHDDILDKEILRRDKPAFHIQYGLGASILTADFVFGIILDIAPRYNDKRVATELSSVALRMCEGEYSELKIDPKVVNLSWDKYIDLISKKTASLFESSAKIGGIIGGGTEEEVQALSHYGYTLGMAYQIQDDAFDGDKEGEISHALDLGDESIDRKSYLRTMAETYARKAKQTLYLLKDTKAKKHLLDLADFMISSRFL